MTRREFRTLSPPAAVREAIDELQIRAEAVQVPLSDAQGRVLTERIDAPLDVPGFDRSAMDGYALRATETAGASESTPVELGVSATVHAGTRPDVTVASGTAVEIATGAVMPAGADAVVPVEQTREHGGSVEITTAVTPGDHVMPSGADVASGARTLGPGTRLDARHVGLLAALGLETVPVRAKPTVGIVSTGGELVQPGDDLDPAAGQIYDVNSHSLGAAVAAAGGVPRVFETTADDPEQMREVLDDAAAESTLLLTSGSTSAGSSDLLYELLDTHGEKLVHGVSLKPGRPTLVGRLFGTPYVGLPGYPVSALTIFRTFVGPALREATGTPEPPTATVDATLRTRVHYDGGRLRLLAVGLVEDGDGSTLAYAPGKGSGATTALVETDGIVRMPPERSLYEPGTAVTVERFDPSAPIPSVLGMGEPDPVVYALLDKVAGSRYLTPGLSQSERWFEQAVPDLLVTTTPATPDDAVEVADWHREWGLATAPDADIAGLDALVDGDWRFANLDSELGLRDAFDALLSDDDGDHDTKRRIDGYERVLPGIESAARSVRNGRADAGLCLGHTADSLGLDFHALGEQSVRAFVRTERREKDGVDAFERAVATGLDDLISETPGYSD